MTTAARRTGKLEVSEGAGSTAAATQVAGEEQFVRHMETGIGWMDAFVPGHELHPAIPRDSQQMEPSGLQWGEQ